VQNTTLLGIDTGGTFTDFVLLDLANARWRVHKVLSTPAEPQQAILRGITELGLLAQVRTGAINIVHGTTVATNAALEGKGARTAYITNQGLKDVLRIGRQTRKALYSLSPDKDEIPLDPELLFEVPARTDADGNVLQCPSDHELTELKAAVESKQPEAIAINLLFSYLNPEQEIIIAELFKDSYFVSRSSEILPEYKEFERGATTWTNSWLGPRIARYMKALEEDLQPAPIAIMQSSGLTIAARLAAQRAVNLLLSGPAGGLAAAKYIGANTNKRRLLTFDMGGTSTDVALIKDNITLTNEGKVAGIPIGVPMADIHTIGAGGGSIGYIDDGGLLRVGPESAGASPGPACYGKGGKKPTVTDANLVLGRLPQDAALADGLVLDLSAARAAIAPLASQLDQTIIETAEGIIAIANEHMVQALRVISINRGHDPREFSLACFGGAGGLHVCDLAEALEMTEILVPIHGGVLSALGMLTSHPGREMIRTAQTLTSDITSADVDQLSAELERAGRTELAAEGVRSPLASTSLDLRYVGQTATLNIAYTGDIHDAVARFGTAHEQQFGHRLERPVELLNCRVHLEGTEPLPELPAVDRDGRIEEIPSNGVITRRALAIGKTFTGPALVLDDHSTIRIGAHWDFNIDEFGNLFLKRHAAIAGN
jgi:N-methylhydantoinase A